MKTTLMETFVDLNVRGALIEYTIMGKGGLMHWRP